jgi:hypothetical protein
MTVKKVFYFIIQKGDHALFFFRKLDILSPFLGGRGCQAVYFNLNRNRLNEIPRDYFSYQ